MKITDTHAHTTWYMVYVCVLLALIVFVIGFVLVTVNGKLFMAELTKPTFQKHAIVLWLVLPINQHYFVFWFENPTKNIEHHTKSHGSCLRTICFNFGFVESHEYSVWRCCRLFWGENFLMD